MAPHRVPLMNASLQRHPDPAESRDPQVRRLVAALRTLDDAPSPSPRFRAELRAQLVAVGPRLITEAAETEQKARTARPAAGRRAPLRFARPLAVLTCVLALVAAVVGGAMFASRKALPGDALYGLKRASENLREAVTHGDTSKGKLLLSFAATRYDEIVDLLPRAGALGSGVQAAGGTIDQHTASLVEANLSSANSDLLNGMQSLGAYAIKNASGSVFAVVVDWYPAPLSDMNAIVARIQQPGSLRVQAVASRSLLKEAAGRAKELQALGNCACLSSGYTDKYGPRPCHDCTAPTSTTTPAQTGTGSSAPGQSSPASAAPGSPGTSGASSSPDAPGGPSDPGGPGGPGSSSAPGSTDTDTGTSSAPPTDSTSSGDDSESNPPSTSSEPTLPITPPPSLPSLPETSSDPLSSPPVTIPVTSPTSSTETTEQAKVSTPMPTPTPTSATTPTPSPASTCPTLIDVDGVVVDVC